MMRIRIALIGIMMMASPAFAVDQVSRERDIVDLRLGQRVQVDDGACPAGQIKEILGAKLGPNGVIRTAKCVPRAGSKS